MFEETRKAGTSGKPAELIKAERVCSQCLKKMLDGEALVMIKADEAEAIREMALSDVRTEVLKIAKLLKDEERFYREEFLTEEAIRLGQLAKRLREAVK